MIQSYQKFGLVFKVLQYSKAAFLSDSSRANGNISQVKNLVDYWRRRLEKSGLDGDEVSSSLRWVAEHVLFSQLGPQWKHRYVQWEMAFANNHQVIEQFEQLCKQREKREPLQYILGNWDFRNLNLLMRKPVFIPRPETEGLIDLIKDWIKSKSSMKRVDVLEVGGGSGAISLALADEVKQIHCTTIDISKEAVELCKENAKRTGLNDRVNVFHQDFDSFLGSTTDKYDVIVSNPPYIPSRQLQQLQAEVRHEDYRALDGGPDGLDIILKIVTNAARLLSDKGCLFLEVDVSHPDLLRSTDICSWPQLEYVRAYSDIFERPRFCHFEKK